MNWPAPEHQDGESPVDGTDTGRHPSHRVGYDMALTQAAPEIATVRIIAGRGAESKEDLR